MTVVNAIPELWSASLERALTQATLWGRLTRDVSGEVPYGDKLHINQITSSVTISDNARNTDIAAAQNPSTDDTELDLDKRKVFNISVDDVDEVQTRPSVLAEYTRMAGEAMAAQFDDDLYDTFNDNWDTTGSDRNAWSAALKPSAINDSSKRAAMVEEIRDYALRADRANWPESGRWMVLSPEVFDLVMEYFTVDKPNLGAGGIVDEATTEGTRRRLFGFTVHKYNGIPATEATNVPMAMFGLNSWGVFARQVTRTEAYRPDLRFSDNVKGILVYGAKEIHKERKMILRQPS